MIALDRTRLTGRLQLYRPQPGRKSLRRVALRACSTVPLLPRYS